jgi:hypothetical protein
MAASHGPIVSDSVALMAHPLHPLRADEDAGATGAAALSTSSPR